MREQIAVMLMSVLGGLGNGERPADTGEAGVRANPQPPMLMLQPVAPQESIYAPPGISDLQGGYNDGALTIEIVGRYMTDYIYRGLEVVEPGAQEDAVNFQLGADLRLDLGRLPDPFFRVLTNTAEGDDISNFQIIRPALGLEWETEAFDLAIGTQSYTYPDRTDLDTAEVFADLRINDGVFYSEEGPFLGPFVVAVWDIDRYEGLYVEGGLRRTFNVADTNLRLTIEGVVGYVHNYELYSRSVDNDGTGFSHYQVGIAAEYRLNTLLNISRRYGQWSLAGYLNYTDGIDNDLATTTQIWGGGGIVFRY